MSTEPCGKHPSFRGATVCLLAATAVMVGLSSLSSQHAPAAAIAVSLEQDALPITEHADAYPKWTHHFLFESHFTVLENGNDGALFAMMDAELLIHGQTETAPLTTILEPGDIALDGAFENVGSSPVSIFSSDGELIQIKPGYRIVVSDNLLYGHVAADRGTGTETPNGCLCECGNGWIPLKAPGGQSPPRCDGYVDGNCIDPTNHQLETISQCVPGYIETNE